MQSHLGYHGKKIIAMMVFFLCCIRAKVVQSMLK